MRRNLVRMCLLGGLGLGCASAPRVVAPPPAPAPAVPPEKVVRGAPKLDVREVPLAAFTDPERPAKIAAALPEIRAEVAQIVAADLLVGIAIGVVVDGELVLGEGFGARHIDEGGTIDIHTRFRIGSITKIFTAMTALRLAEQGRLELDSPAAAVLPELHALVYPAADARRLTVRDILTHTSGLPRGPDLAPLAVTSAPTRQQLMQAIDGLSLRRVPGIEYEYSNLGYSLLGHIVAAASGQPYHDAIHDAILAPLGMHHTVWEPSDVPPPQLATGHIVSAAKVIARTPTRHGAIDAAGGLFSTVDDLSRFVAFQLGAWPPRGAANPGPLSPTLVRESQRIQAFRSFRAGTAPAELTPDGVEGATSGVGFTWGVTHGCEDSHTVGHNGAVDGYFATIRMLPQAGIGIIVLGNAGWASTDHIARTIHRALDRHGALGSRAPAALPALDTAAQGFIELFAHWDPAAFAERTTLALREPPARLRIAERLHWLGDALGACTLGPLKRSTSAWSGVYPVTCERGDAELSLALTTARTPKIADFELNWTDGTPTKPVHEAAEAAVALLTKFDEAKFRALFSPDYTRTNIDNFVARVRHEHGVCRLDRPLEVPGPDAATFALVCDKGSAKVSLSLEPGPTPRINSFRVRTTGKVPRCR